MTGERLELTHIENLKKNYQSLISILSEQNSPELNNFSLHFIATISSGYLKYPTTASQVQPHRSGQIDPQEEWGLPLRYFHRPSSPGGLSEQFGQHPEDKEEALQILENIPEGPWGDDLAHGIPPPEKIKITITRRLCGLSHCDNPMQVNPQHDSEQKLAQIFPQSLRTDELSRLQKLPEVFGVRQHLHKTIYPSIEIISFAYLQNIRKDIKKTWKWKWKTHSWAAQQNSWRLEI